jgi:hypothetical protein
VAEQHRRQNKKPAERLRDYFQQLPPKTLSLLATEFEKALARGEDTVVAEFVLGELRKLVRHPDATDLPRIDDLQRVVFAPLEPFLVDGADMRPGQIKRSSLGPIWAWLTQAGAPEQAETFRREYGEAREANQQTACEQSLRRFHLAAAEAIAAVLAPSSADRHRGRAGAPGVVEDLPAVQIILANRDALETLRSRLPRIMSIFGDVQVASIRGVIGQLPSLQSGPVLPFVISLVMQRMTSPWQITRLAVNFAASDEETRIASTPFGVAVTMALHDLAAQVDQLLAEIKRGHFDEGAHHLKSLHDGVRDLRSELDFRSDSTWGRQLSAIRAGIANSLTSEIESVPGRVRRLLRQRSDRDINAGARLDTSEADETVALVNFVAICRNYASELAISEVTLRSFSDMQHYLETATEALVESLRSGDARVRAFRQMQVELAIRFCEVIFGHDYASLMNKAAEVALSGERKSSRAS